MPDPGRPSGSPLNPGNPATGLPPLGKVDIEPKRTCTRFLRLNDDGSERLCDAPATRHVDWGPHAGFCCSTHWSEAKGCGWRTVADHALGPYCGMPGALWFNFPDGSSHCAYDADGLPVAEVENAEAVSA